MSASHVISSGRTAGETRRPHLSLYAWRTRSSLAWRLYLHLLSDHRSGLLVPLYVLAGDAGWWWRDGPILAPWLGLAFTLSMFWMYKMWRRDMLTTDADRRWSKVMKKYIENDDQNLPPIGRFNYGQKLFFWLMFYGVILLLISGVGLWFVESIPWSLRWLRYTAVTVHVVAALATIGGFIIHVYMGTAMVRGGFTSIIRGEVTTAWARTHHRLWYEQVTKGTSADK